MRPADVATVLRSLYPTRRPIWLSGPPGVGKSAVAEQAARGLQVNYLDVRLLLHDPSDLKFPIVDTANKRIDWVCSLFPQDPKWEGIIALEELALAPPLMQGAILQAVWDRRIGSTPISPGITFLALSNRAEDRAGVGRVISPLLNRFIHLDMEVSNEDWMAWALSAGIAPEVRGFLNFKPDQLFAFDPSANKRAFPTPRSWSFVSDIIGATPLEFLLPVVAGCVGDAAAAMFTAFVRIYRDLPDPEVALQNPTGIAIPRDLSVLHALSMALVERLRGKNADTKLLANFVTFTSRLPDEFGVLCMQSGLVVNPKLMLAPGASQWLAAARKKGIFQFN